MAAKQKQGNVKAHRSNKWVPKGGGGSSVGNGKTKRKRK
jgi:hypothetical protein